MSDNNASQDQNKSVTSASGGDNDKQKEKKNKKGKGGFVLKTPKGTKDFGPAEMVIREHVFDTVTQCFRRHGAVRIQTPLFELKETLTGKYGEDSKLIYDLADQGGEISALRYDLTVPFARYMAQHRVVQIKRYQIGRVFRRDQPVMNKGRFREFYQCDFDIAGQYDTMVPDAECLTLMAEILGRLGLHNFKIKINHRQLLEAMFELAGAPADQFATICSSVDKLDKEPWDVVRAELVDTKGLQPEIADRIGQFVQLHDEPAKLLERLDAEQTFAASPVGVAALEQMRLLTGYLEAYGCPAERLQFDLSLARGLDYYTGLIFEALYFGDGKNKRVGSIAGGGRYDDLVGMFSGKPVPSVGFSLGVERIFTLLEEKQRKAKQTLRESQTDVLVASIGANLLAERMRICKMLWDADIKAELVPKKNPKIQQQLKKADQGIPFAVIFGEDEMAEGKLKVKNMLADESDPEKEITVAKAELCQFLKEKLNKSN